MATASVYLSGEWKPSSGLKTFQAHNPTTGEVIGDPYPISNWTDMEQALQSASECDLITRDWSGDRFAGLLEAYASQLENRGDEIVEQANLETALPVTPRLKGAEFPRTLAQLRAAAQAARSGEWAMPVIDQANNIRSMYRSIGPVFVIGPNNFPLAFNGISGGDFAAAVAAGNPVIVKAHPAHPGTTRLMAECLVNALMAVNFPANFIQLIYEVAPEEGLKAIRDSRIAAVGFTGSQKAGIAIKAAADKAGKPVYVEMSSINPVFVLPGTLAEKSDAFAEEFTGSCLMGSGQFCTNPGLVILPPGNETAKWIENVRDRFANAKSGPLLTEGVKDSLLDSIQNLVKGGAELLTGGHAAKDIGGAAQNTLLCVDAEKFLADSDLFQQEAFGNCSLIVKTSDPDQMTAIAQSLEGQLTGCVYLTDQPEDEAIYQQLEPILRRRVGRLINNKMPTGVAVSPAMNHGGPFPATGHPGFTAVGIPASIRRFSMLECYDNVPEHRLPIALRNA
ncbi:aldehyde dehydrogenase family protein [Rubinisphaera italica]|uniref:NADP-dependent fatty aldehyde dehydrogenase n=1 Tax=Rubinisphaera italica TaxID=2527969 RepID=A0A5C5XIM4_9PLAN|nr:aldehyde dehydrogenase family protein [Rubinisphaera italica]TWT62624.1 NADP-dependent fatty aldehyde dehydrogenase [Rubinisphaera italica]